MVRTVLRVLFGQVNESESNKVIELMVLLITKMDLESLIPYRRYFLGSTPLTSRDEIVASIKSHLGDPQFTDENQSIWSSDGLSIRAWLEHPEFKVEMSPKC